MNVLNNTINSINRHIRELPDKLSAIGNDELEKIPAPGKWSKKEILGHLCDSAVNNLSRFIRAQYEPEPFNIITYNQDNWVRANNYRNIETDKILNYWVILNSQIAGILENIPGQKLAVRCIISYASFSDGGGEKSLLWLIEDYLEHMEYHLKQITGGDN